MNIRTFIYDRIQANAADDPAAELARREAKLREYAEQNNMDVVGVSNDIGSVNDQERPALRQMIDTAERKEFDILLVNDLDRITREMFYMMKFCSLLSSCGIEIHTPQGEVNAITE